MTASLKSSALQVFLFLLSLIAYWFILPFHLALALILTITIHEFGHIVAMYGRGYAPSGMYLIPFLGGFVIEPKYRDGKDEFIVVMGGPLFGLMGAYTGHILNSLHPALLFSELCTFSALLNVINLLPLPPLDGGRVMRLVVGAIHQHGTIVYSISTILLCSVLGYSLNLMFLLVLSLALAQGAKDWERPKQFNRLTFKESMLGLPYYILIFGLLVRLSQHLN